MYMSVEIESRKRDGAEDGLEANLAKFDREEFPPSPQQDDNASTIIGVVA